MRICVGYGDIYPQTPMGRYVAVIAALLAGLLLIQLCQPAALPLSLSLALAISLSRAVLVPMLGRGRSAGDVSKAAQLDMKESSHGMRAVT